MQPETINRKLVIVLLIAGILLSIFFGIRVARPFMHGFFHPYPIRTDVSAIRSWMTLPYISRVYGVPENLLFQQLGISPIGNTRNNLDMLNRLYFNSQPGIVLEKVKTAISQYQQTHPTPQSPAK